MQENNSQSTVLYKHISTCLEADNSQSQRPLDNSTIWGLDESDMPALEPVEWCRLCGEAKPVCKYLEVLNED